MKSLIVWKAHFVMLRISQKPIQVWKIQHLWSLNSNGLLRPYGYPFKRLYSKICATHSYCRAFGSGAVTSSSQSRHFIGKSLFCYSLPFQIVWPSIWTNFIPRPSWMFYVHGSGGMENDDNDVAGNDDNDRQNIFWLKPCLKLLPKKKRKVKSPELF